ncbi:GTP-binding protein Obg [Mesoplasma florum W37]|uniref:GTPase Obg n=1 Tax=Mesoplasma florum TaxID=2151 RepID=A0A2R3P037_MESFO|nr:GTPase ObgE [Mesoplasma florum]AGY41618.1 GTP-binding protein Obg [Mesoplasma florum W37]ATI73487.1 GTPase Obg [Mesoplasma florum]ATI74172.1 GTPase Obg [Mesoplasma florum]AVN59133.1 GTPase Obg [Mesoplasma florum]AVN59826.1 GTPase Obg [Mesoplasma florum]
MKFIDTAKFTIKAGNGGNGAVSFHTALFVPNGGPNGGDGGNGGSVIFEADGGKHSLLDLKLQKQLSAQDGFKGDIKNMHGAQGKDLIVRVPVGTLIIDNKTGTILADMDEDKKQVLVAKGGKGGKGNARFANSRNKAPTIFEAGEIGQFYEVKAELKVLADVGFVGLPNAGKSTLLRAISNSKPEVADYAFTTLNPQLGVSRAKDGSTFVVADLPGLIEGASLGKGLGHQFLKHIERCRVICHVLDMSGNYGQEDVIKNYELIRSELVKYNYKLDERPEIIVANKMDTDEAQLNMMEEDIKKYFKDKKVVFVSGLLKDNVDELLLKIAKELETAKYVPLWEMEQDIYEGIKVYRLEEDEEDIQIINKGNGRWEVAGDTIYKIYQKFPITTDDNLLLFNEKLKKSGVYDMLRERGVGAGDIVKVFEYELEWMD